MIRCKLFGCKDVVNQHGYSSHCVRCGEHCWSSRYVCSDECVTWLACAPLRWFRRQFARLAPQYCWGCNKRLYPWNAKYHGEFCCSECFKNWMPF